MRNKFAIIAIILLLTGCSEPKPKYDFSRVPLIDPTTCIAYAVSDYIKAMKLDNMYTFTCSKAIIQIDMFLYVQKTEAKLKGGHLDATFDYYFIIAGDEKKSVAFQYFNTEGFAHYLLDNKLQPFAAYNIDGLLIPNYNFENTIN